MNSRFRCNETMNRLKYDAKTGYRPHQAHDPWFGIEQEYCVIDDADKPVSYNPHNYDYKTLRKIFIDIFQQFMNTKYFAELHLYNTPFLFYFFTRNVRDIYRS